MNYKMLAKVCIRLIALFYMVNYLVITISSVISILEVLRHPVEYNGVGLLSAVTPMSLMVIIGILLWLNADKIAVKLVGEAPAEGTIQNVDYNKVQYIALLLAGILIVCNSVPDLFSSIYQINSMPKPPIEIPDRIYSGYMAKLIGAIIKTLMGTYLVLGSKGIGNMIEKFRSAGLNDESQQTE